PRKDTWWRLAVVSLVCAVACLERPVVPAEPETTNIFVDQIVQTGVDKIDLLFMIDLDGGQADDAAASGPRAAKPLDRAALRGRQRAVPRHDGGRERRVCGGRAGVQPDSGHPHRRDQLESGS